MKVSKTHQCILETAELMFSEQGFEQTSLRQITSEAGVNLASVNYHFGSKKALIQSVMERYQSVFMPALDTELNKLLASGTPLTTENILTCVVQPLARTTEVRKNGPAVYLRLLGYAYSEIQGHLRVYTMTRFGDVVQKLFTAIQQANPDVSPGTLFWRLHFSLGAALFAQVSGQALAEIAEADFDEKISAEQVVLKLLPFITAGISAGDAEFNPFM